MAALVWLVAGVLLLAAEVLSGDFVLLMIGVAALAAAGSAAAIDILWVDVAVFAVSSIVLLAAVRPALRRRMLAGDHVKTNVEALVGGKAVVLSTVDAHGGQVKLGGEIWSARAYDETQVIEVGRAVTVMDIAGATAVVWAEG
ncbi:NfeD family protein [Crossiella cryophila]|uniref:Membrane protein implicated in regulation of membrane protease activity n=1 Tax=Crossiella cryophila TaxID=43355 RepID=A0A7W7CAP6_9PSEU|nr:NfeD family protein [Crossiella cryophila]MBB4677669.1 membrane protein implicated in regulation of membrane protease activity [Crossiella cryophila]